MMFSKVDYIKVNVSDMSRSVAFYGDILGLPLKFQSPAWSEFQTGANSLAHHLIRARGCGEVGAPAEPLAGTYSIGFLVEDLAATHRELSARGAQFVRTPTEQANEGIRLAVCVDPDGLPIAFAEPLEAPRREQQWR
jgi:lactoylglutathione lyase